MALRKKRHETHPHRNLCGPGEHGGPHCCDDPVPSPRSIATTALVLIVPVIIGTVSGGFIAGMISVGAGFLVYVFFFIQPYLTWYVGKTENWVPLGVYVVVMVPVARVVAGMNTAREKERRPRRGRYASCSSCQIFSSPTSLSMNCSR